MNKLFIVFLLIIVTINYGNEMNEKELRTKAKQLAKQILIVDTHVDVPYRLFKDYEDISKRTTKGDYDYPRAIEGCVDASFMAVYVPAKHEDKGGGKKLADSLINIMEGVELEDPDKFQIAYSVQDVLDNFEKGIISMPLGMENGTPIEGKLENVQHFYDRGISYITLTHGKNNHIGDSSYEDVKEHGGLTEFGKKLVTEMNNVGIMVDISHVSDDTFYDVMKIAKVPAIASHSSCRKFTPNFERNMNDDMIKLLAKNGGVIQITFGSMFIDGDFLQASRERRNTVAVNLQKKNISYNSYEGREYRSKYYKKHPLHYPTIEKIVDHIDHVVNLVGIDYVGLGSDFDGVGDSLPIGLRDVADIPNIIYELLKRGYSEEDIEKICSGNILRVWKATEDYAATH